MKRLKVGFHRLIGVCLVSITYAGSAFAGHWDAIPTDGRCSSGSPYYFYAHKGSSDKLLIFFNGGGACWYGAQCDPDRSPNAHITHAEDRENNPEGFDGIFDFENRRNPVSDYTMIVLPYCTGDAFIGAGLREYPLENGTSVEVFHNGMANTSQVLDWVYENVPVPTRILVSGVSAGAIGSSFHAGRISAHYYDTPVALITDAGGGFRTPNISKLISAWDVESILPDWPEYAGATNATLTFQDFYIASANHAKNLTIAQVNSAYDWVQRDVSALMGDAPSDINILDRLLENHREITAEVDRMATYITEEQQHVAIITPQFYTYETQRTRLSKWFADLAAGLDVRDVSCLTSRFGCGEAP